MKARFISSTIEKSPKSVLLLGPRQVGKSTLLESLSPELSINLGLQSEFLAFNSNPDELENRIQLYSPETILLDEIQRIPDLLNTIQVFIDNNKGKMKFYLSGSSARKLRRGSANLLPGRIFTYRLGPLSCLDLDYKIDSQRALEMGCLPEPYFSKNRTFSEKLLRSYVGTYLQEEILAESLVRQVQGFSRFLNVTAENSGKFLDFSKIATKSKVNRSAARRFYEILEDTLICDRLEPYPNEGADLVKHSKYYLFDIGVVNGLLGNFHASADRIGLLFEHLFFNQLKNTSYSIDKEMKIFHFRTRGGLEVDFIVEIDNRTIAIELKVSEPSSSELLPLKNLDKYFKKPIEKYVACLKVKPKKIQGIEILEWQTVMKRLFR